MPALDSIVAAQEAMVPAQVVDSYNRTAAAPFGRSPPLLCHSTYSVTVLLLHKFVCALLAATGAAVYIWPNRYTLAGEI